MKNIVMLAVLAVTVGFHAYAAGLDPMLKKGIIPTTPPAPTFTDSERQQELARRRAAVAEKMGSGSVAIFFSSSPRIYTNDVDFMYRQENNHYYLTNLRKDGSTLVLLPGNGSFTEVLFLPKRDPQAETWNGKMYSKEEATRISGIKTVLNTEELTPFMDAVKARKAFTSKQGGSVFTMEAPAGAESKLYLLLPRADFDENGKREYAREAEFAQKWKDVAGFKIENAQPIFSQLRLVKSPTEIKWMQHAVDITTEAQLRVMSMVGKASWEYEVQAEVEYIFRKRNADYWGYPSIVGCGPNATTLHYVESQGAVKPGDLLLMDVGAEYEHYTADVTRTFPVNGKFTKEQAEIYQIVFDAQEANAKATKPGVTLRDVHNASLEVVKKGLAKAGLTTGPDDMIPGTKTPQHRIWFMHGTSHWLGMNVHDLGGGSKMLAGSIFTNEPGVYVREDALDYFPDSPEMRAFLAKIRPAFEKYKNIGVRIEDDMLVTANGVEWMTGKLPRSIKDIEEFMAKASKRNKYSALLNEDKSPAMAFLGNSVDLNWNPFESERPLSGVTQRRGWVYTGNDATLSGLTHGHDHAE
jgi:Xaa-Pro aminopeptidase